MTPESLKEKIVKIGGDRFKVITALKLSDDEWSLVGFVLDEEGQPRTNHAEHLMVDPILIEIE